MLDLFEHKIKFTVLYKHAFCSFIPYEQVEFNLLPESVNGIVVYPEVGEYNPSSWAKPLTVQKKYLLQKSDMNKYENLATL